MSAPHLLPPAKIISNDAELAELVDQLANVPLIALDTESNSLHAYRERVCLIQLSTRDHDYIIDPFAITTIAPLGRLLANPHIEKVFHAAEYDIGCLKRDFGFHIHNLFDTMWAARVTGHTAFGLGALLDHYFGVTIDKSHQRDNWGLRPLPADSLRYAQMDTHYLPALRDILHQQLRDTQRLDEALEIFHDVTLVEQLPPKSPDPEGFWDLGLPNALTRKQMSILRELYILRETIAQEKDCPPTKILSNKTLIELATTAPNTEWELYNIRELNGANARRYGEALLQAIERGRGSRLPSPPRHEPPNPLIAEIFTQLNDWRRSVAAQRGVAVDVIMSRQTLWEVARRLPKTLADLEDIRGFGPWRLKTYGHQLLDIIQQHPSNRW